MNMNPRADKTEKYKKACDGGSAVACNKLGLVYYAGRGVTQDNLKAVELFKRACNGGDATGCTFLGFMYNNGIAVEYDELQAVAFYTKACNDGDTLGCENLGILHAKNENLKQNVLCDKASK